MNSHFDCGIRDENISAGAGFTHFGRLRDSFEIDSRIRDEKQKITRYER